MFDSIDIGMGDGFFSDLLGCTNGTVDFFFLVTLSAYLMNFSHKPCFTSFFFLEFFHILGKERLIISFVNRKTFTKSVTILYHQFLFRKISRPPTTEYHLSQKEVI